FALNIRKLIVTNECKDTAFIFRIRTFRVYYPRAVMPCLLADIHGHPSFIVKRTSQVRHEAHAPETGLYDIVPVIPPCCRFRKHIPVESHILPCQPDLARGRDLDSPGCKAARSGIQVFECKQVAPW